MSREWKAGDVATLVVDEQIVRGLVRHHEDDSEPVWLISGHSFFKSVSVNNNVLVGDARPLVVIDPEDRGAVERLIDSYVDVMHGDDANGTRRGAVLKMQAALREYASPKPPKPDEPQGLGAVVEDEDGVKWLRHDSVAIHRRWLNTDDCETRFRTWLEIAAVRVLSPGVEVDQ